MTIRELAVGGTAFADPHAVRELADQSATVGAKAYYVRLDSPCEAAADAVHSIPITRAGADTFEMDLTTVKLGSPFQLIAPQALEAAGYTTKMLTGERGNYAVVSKLTGAVAMG